MPMGFCSNKRFPVVRGSELGSAHSLVSPTSASISRKRQSYAVAVLLAWDTLLKYK